MKRAARVCSKFTGQTQAVEDCLNVRLRDVNQPEIKLLTPKPLPELANYFDELHDGACQSQLLSDADSYLMWFDTRPCSELKEENQLEEKSLVTAPIAGELLISINHGKGPHIDSSSETDLIDLYDGNGMN
jgi:hypothetical protein